MWAGSKVARCILWWGWVCELLLLLQLPCNCCSCPFKLRALALSPAAAAFAVGCLHPLLTLLCSRPAAATAGAAAVCAAGHLGAAGGSSVVRLHLHLRAPHLLISLMYMYIWERPGQPEWGGGVPACCELPHGSKCAAAAAAGPVGAAMAFPCGVPQCADAFLAINDQVQSLVVITPLKTSVAAARI